jgi:hypothetical protein
MVVTPPRYGPASAQLLARERIQPRREMVVRLPGSKSPGRARLPLTTGANAAKLSCKSLILLAGAPRGIEPLFQP